MPEQVCMDSIHHTVLIKWIDKLPDHYFRLASKLKFWNINIVPMDYTDVLKHRFTRHKNILSITSGIESQKNKLKILQPSLNFAIKRGRLTFYDISSFSNPNKNIEELRAFYKFIPLPDRYDEIAKSIAMDILSQTHDEMGWPGGKRSKLPYDVLSN